MWKNLALAFLNPFIFSCLIVSCLMNTGSCSCREVCAKGTALVILSQINGMEASIFHPRDTVEITATWSNIPNSKGWGIRPRSFH